MLWHYKTFHFSPKMRQMMYPDCKTTLNVVHGFPLQNTRETAKCLKRMHIRKAVRFLNDVINKKQCVPFRRFNGGVGRKAQVTIKCPAFV